ncbi:MAG TPA: choice-of-anchor D domain-containing protein, partial [Terracidiphilus sp.]
MVNKDAAAATVLGGLTCNNASITGAGTDACTVALNTPAASGGLVVSLSSGNAAVKVPATVTIPANAISAGFTATVSPVATAQVATLQAVAGSSSNSYTLQLNAAGATLSVNATSVAFNSVAVNTAATQSVTLTSAGDAPLTVSAATVTGIGFTVSGASFPLTLGVGQAVTLTVQFDPTAAGAATGQLAIASNSSTGATTVIDLDGTGTAALSALTCNSASMTGAGTDACTVTLNTAAASGGLVVSLSSSNPAVTVPATVTVPPNAASAGFMATVLPVATEQVVSLKAAMGSASQTFDLQLNPSTPTLSVATSGSPSTYGSAVTFTATISSGPTGIVTFYDGAASIGTGTINGTTTHITSSLSAGSHTITASWPGNSDYGPVTSGAIIQAVNQATPAISWATPAAITYGTALSATQLDATSTVPGTFVYSPAAGAIPA